jgi:molybdate transport system permease protein
VQAGSSSGRQQISGRRTAGGCLLVAVVLVLLAFLVTPLVALVWRALPDLPGSIASPLVAKGLRLSLLTTAATVLISVLVGTPAAYLLARYRFRGQLVLDTLIDLPMVLPPAVAGLALLMAFGRSGLLGGPLTALGISLPFTTAAVILAQTFVAVPLYIRSARAGFGAVNRTLEQIASTLGVSDLRVFLRVTLPLASRSLLAGAILAWARALGEFGATIMFAGNFPGRTQTVPLAIYMGLQEDLGGALTLAVILMAISFGLLVAVRLVTHRGIPDA